ncbi:hypothetical protein CC1G_09156 [Coprinopsis cinerea okayama7|uniref:F-box domain-containing protein n=1 Tax=Coprinopsis cinerea (strain Okayama-7 / 130 / ATCC MYA-4618 / FGSC 9003) TaxID=240176 RepID=A8P9R8_COPC7|nr:hypothetical protein CC1G_09156 [Coprinopsis cinerea okayama7\|eukprot:XP_001839822.1 hypothetical protein CC1G_09156 [Coprinopsis cinerea okayama7\
MTRRSSRLQAKADVKAPRNQATDASADAQPTPMTSSKRKRNAKSEIIATSRAQSAVARDDKKGQPLPTKRRRVKAKDGGIFGKLRDVPFDILEQIFSHLSPMDLVNLARTSKHLRAALLNKGQSLVLWRTVLEQVPGLPRRPEDVSEPAWAEFLFGRTCQICGRQSLTTPQWCSTLQRNLEWNVPTRMRGCFVCLKKIFTTFHDLGRSEPWAVGVPALEFDRSLHTEIFRERYRKYRTLSGDEREAWVKKIKEEWQAKYSGHRECSKWLEKTLAEERKREAELNRRGRDFIYERMKEEGFAEDVGTPDNHRKIGTFYTDKTVATLLRKEVTPEVWANAKDSVMVVAQKYRKLRLERK